MAQGFVAGFARALLWFSDSSGYFTGQQSTLANGSSSGAYVASYVKTAGLQPPAPVQVDIQGGDKIVTTLQFGNAKVPGFDIALSDYDTTLVGLIAGTTVNTTNTFATVVSENPNKTAPIVMGLALQQRYQLISGVDYWMTRFFPKCYVRFKQGGPAFQSPTDQIISVTPIMTDKAHTGQAFGSAGLNLGLELDLADNYSYISANPIHVFAQRSDGAATTFTLTYKPLSTVITLNATPNPMHKNGTATALSSLVIATKVATLAAAGTAADMHVVTYETNYVP